MSSIIEVVAVLSAFAIAANRLLRSSEPLWSFIPDIAVVFGRAVPLAWLRVWLPSLIVLTGYIASHLTGVISGVDLADVLILAVAAAFAAPGMQAHSLGKGSSDGR